MASVQPRLKIPENFFNPVYLPYLDNPERILVLYGGAGSGKSTFIAQKLILKALKYPGRRILCVRKTGSSLRDSVFRELQAQISALKLMDYVDINKTNMSFHFKNDSEIILKGLDDVEKLKSISNISDVWIEEATEVKQQDFQQLNLRIRSKQPNKQIILTFNPVSKSNWVYKYWFEDPDKKHPDTVIIKTTYKDNKFIDEDYKRAIEALKETDPTYYRIYALGEFASLEKLIFSRWKERPCKDVTVGKPFVGIDWGFSNDPTSIVKGRIDTEKRVIYVTDEYTSTGMFIDEIAERLRLMGVTPAQMIVADSAEPRSIADLQRKGFSVKGVKKGKDSVLHGIEWLKTHEIIVDPSCETLIAELQDYAWKKDPNDPTGQTYLNVPTGRDHAIDALRYGTEPFRVRKGGRVFFADKSLIV